MLDYNFDEKANDVINFAFAEARDLGHKFIGTEHFALGLSLIKGSKVTELLESYGVTHQNVKMEIVKIIGKGDPSEGIEDYTRRARECLERSHQYAVKTNNSEIIPEHIFLAIMHDRMSMGYKILSRLNLDIASVLKGVLIEQQSAILETNIIKGDATGKRNIKMMELSTDYEEEKVSTFGLDLTERAKDVPFDIVIGREEIIERILLVLSRKTKNNACLVGEPGVGKTAIVQGLANRIADGHVPDVLRDKKIIEVNIGSLVSGTSYRGQFEERMNDWIQSMISGGDTIAFIDEIHNLIGVGATGDKSLDAIGMLKPYLANGQIQIIGATTYDDFQKYMEPDQALIRRMTVIDVKEPTDEETYEILNHVKSNYEIHHGVVIGDDAVRSAIQLSKRYLTDRRLPDKAIDLIDEASSRKRYENIKTLEIIDELKYRLQQLKTEKENSIIEMDFENASKIQSEEKRILSHIEKNRNTKALMSSQKLLIGKADIEKVVSDWVQIPITKLSSNDKERLVALESKLSESIFGQENAINVVSRALKRSRIGIKDPKKPTGVFLFVGPTGVGKTELARKIADVFYGDDRSLIKIDMSEYMEKHAVSKLIGSPPGYEGHREGGYLTGAVKKNPYSVVVFDEVEKAHEEVIDILLQVMDEGTLKDGRGVSVNFKDALIILTSNLGTKDLVNKQVGFLKSTDAVNNEEKIREACKSFFKPEFINRMDEIIVFDPLSVASASLIVRKHIDAFKNQMSEKNLEITVSDDVIEWIAKSYYSPEYGARPLGRAVDKEIKDVVAEYVLESIEESFEISFDFDDSKKMMIHHKTQRRKNV
jgi:ATP-dependent Clp protease ATP-binding subunit ClpC